MGGMELRENIERSVGQRIRFLRKQKGLTLRELAEMCDLSINAISRIERGLNSPTLSSMHRLALSLGVSIADFFDDGIPRRVVHLKAGQRRQERINGRILEILGAGFADPMTEPFLVTLEPGVGNSAGPITHPGEEFVFSLEGQVEFEILGTSYLLNEGDSLLFKCDQLHCWRNPADRPSRFLVVFVGSEGQSMANLESL